MKYGPLRWELKEQYKGYEVHQYNIIMDVLGGWSEETEISVRSLVGRKTTQVLEKMQKAVLSATLAQHCKNFQSSNMMFYYTKIDRPAMNRPAITFIHFDINYDF